MAQNGRPIEHVFIVLSAIAVIVALTGIACQGILCPLLISTPTVEGTVSSYREICTRPWRMRDDQFAAHVRQFEGKQIVNWRGWVLGQQALGGWYNFEIASEPPGDLALGRDIVLYGVPASTAEGLRQGQEITFSGTIRQVEIWDGICKAVIEDVTVMP